MIFKNKYKEELSDIRFTENFEDNTVSMLAEANERKVKTMITKRKPLKTAALAVAIIMILTCSAFAIATFLNPSDVANHLGEKELAEFFDENYFEPITVKGEVYTVTFMGMAPGEEFYSYKEGGDLVSENRSYAVIAIYRNDGKPLSSLDDSPLQVIPVMDGYRPNVFFSQGMSSQRFCEEGVLYYLWDYTDLEVFADKNIRLMAYEGAFPTGILVPNDNGEIVYAEGYNGFKAVFELDLDESKADPAKAEELLRME